MYYKHIDIMDSLKEEELNTNHCQDSCYEDSSLDCGSSVNSNPTVDNTTDVSHLDSGNIRPLKRKRDTKDCWLCVYATDTTAVTINNLIADHVHCMSIDVIAEQSSQVIAQHILKRNPCNANAVSGYSANDIKNHVFNHMLNPNVTLSITLRNLIDIHAKLHDELFIHDNEKNKTVIHTNNLRNYLSVVNQITGMYKLGENNNLLFSRNGAAISLNASESGKGKK